MPVYAAVWCNLALVHVYGIMYVLSSLVFTIQESI